MGESVNDLAKAKVNNSHCSSLVCTAARFSMESNQVRFGLPLEDPCWLFPVSNCSACAWILKMKRRLEEDVFHNLPRE